MIVTDTSAFEGAVSRLCASLITVGEQSLRAHAGEDARQMAMATPPGDASVQGGMAFAKGRSAVLGNTLRVIRPVRGRGDGESVETVIRAHWRRGRTIAPVRRIAAPYDEFAEYLSRAYQTVGYTAGGFAVAAQALGTTLPDWIADKPGPGSVSVTSTASLIEIRFANLVSWLAELDGVEARIAGVMQRRAMEWRTRISEEAQRLARAAGFGG